MTNNIHVLIPSNAPGMLRHHQGCEQDKGYDDPNQHPFLFLRHTTHLAFHFHKRINIRLYVPLFLSLRTLRHTGFSWNYLSFSVGHTPMLLH